MRLLGEDVVAGAVADAAVVEARVLAPASELDRGWEAEPEVERRRCDALHVHGHDERRLGRFLEAATARELLRVARAQPEVATDRRGRILDEVCHTVQLVSVRVIGRLCDGRQSDGSSSGKGGRSTDAASSVVTSW